MPLSHFRCHCFEETGCQPQWSDWVGHQPVSSRRRLTPVYMSSIVHTGHQHFSSSSSANQSISTIHTICQMFVGGYLLRGISHPWTWPPNIFYFSQQDETFSKCPGYSELAKRGEMPRWGVVFSVTVCVKFVAKPNIPKFFTRLID